MLVHLNISTLRRRKIHTVLLNAFKDNVYMGFFTSSGADMLLTPTVKQEGGRVTVFQLIEQLKWIT